MLIGELLWESVYLAGIILAALCVVLLRARFSKTKGPVSPRLWIRFSAIFFGLCLVGLIEGSLLAPYGFGWFLAAMGLTLYLVAKVTPKLFGLAP